MKSDIFGIIVGSIISFIFYIRFTYGIWDIVIIYSALFTFIIGFIAAYIEATNDAVHAVSEPEVKE